MNRLHTLLLTSALLASGCVTYQGVNADCNRAATPFPDVVACINKQAEGGTNEYLTMYTLKANQILRQYQAGKVSDADAKVQLQEHYMALRQQQMNAVAAISGMSQSTTCRTRGKTTTCN